MQALGRLFFADEERRELDRLRDEYKKLENSEIRKKQSTLLTESFTINGVVLRSDGNNTFWVNGTSVSESGADQAGIHVIEQSDNTIKIGFSHGSNDVQLKPGQKVIFRENDVPDVH